MKAQQKQNGFTLIELLTVMTLFSVVTTIGVRMFFDVSELWRSTAIKTDLRHNAQNALGILQSDLNQIMSVERCGVGVDGKGRTYTYEGEAHPYWRLQVENDAITFPIAIPNYASGQRELYRVRYSVDRMAKPHKLLRAMMPLHGEAAAGSSPYVMIAEGVVGFRVEYHDGQTWHTDWPAGSGAGMPKMIRANLTLHDADRPHEQFSWQCSIPVRVE